MFKKLFTVAVLAISASGALLVTGCSSGAYSLTGEDQAVIRERQRWTDDKGHYRPEWQNGHAPYGYPKELPK